MRLERPEMKSYITLKSSKSITRNCKAWKRDILTLLFGQVNKVWDRLNKYINTYTFL